MKPRWTFWRTTIIGWGLFCFLVGLMLSKTAAYNPAPYLLVLSITLLMCFRRRNMATLLVACLIGLLFGLWRGGVVRQHLVHYDQWYGKTVSVQGTVLDDPVYDNQGRLDFRIGAVKIEQDAALGQVRVKGFINGLKRGDSIALSGKLSDGFGNYQASMYFASAESIIPSKSVIEKIRREFFAAVYSVLPEPQASLGLGFLVGLRSALPEDLDNQLRVAGLTHIVVASGYNLTILVRLSRRLFAQHSKYQALMSSLLLIAGFLAVTGASPSMVRASVVTVLSLVAWYYGRRFHPLVIIMLGAALTAAANPLYIWYDLGWWLSFLAFAGVLVLAPLATALLYSQRTPPLIAQLAIETASAQLMVLPLILFTFGELSLVAILANVAVAPVIPIAMAGTFLAGMGYLLLPAGIAGWLGIPAHLVLEYVVTATRIFAAPSWAQQQLSMSFFAMIVTYVLLFAAGVLAYKRSKFSLLALPSVVE